MVRTAEAVYLGCPLPAGPQEERYTMNDTKVIPLAQPEQFSDALTGFIPTTSWLIRLTMAKS